VRSGSGGLQEACGYALTQGGGCVALTPQWFASVGIALTGKAALLTYIAALKSLGATIIVLDYSGSSGATAGTNMAQGYTAAAGSVYAGTGIRLY
jgi:hypothetical protein